MANPISTMKQIATLVDIFSELSAVDTDKDGIPDLSVEAISLGSKLIGQFNDMQDTVKELTELLGDNVEHIKTRLGIE